MLLCGLPKPVAKPKAVAERAARVKKILATLDKMYPGLGEHLETETTVAIDGAIHETAYFQPIREGCEIFFIPKLEGG